MNLPPAMVAPPHVPSLLHWHSPNQHRHIQPRPRTFVHFPAGTSTFRLRNIQNICRLRFANLVTLRIPSQKLASCGSPTPLSDAQPSHHWKSTGVYPLSTFALRTMLVILGNAHSSCHNKRKTSTQVQNRVRAKNNATVGGLLQLWHACTAVTSLYSMWFCLQNDFTNYPYYTQIRPPSATFNPSQ